MLSLAPQYGYIVGVAAAGWFIHNLYMAIGVGGARKKYGIKYPDLYATPENCKDEKARNAFNCVQRAHQNSLENLPSFYALLTLAGLRHPVTAAVCGAVVLVGRIVYFNAYSTGQPDKRMWGAPLIYPPLFTLVGICVKAAIEAFKA